MLYMENYDYIKQKISELLEIVQDLEECFPGRKFTLDGHLLGSIGEALANYYYGIDLAPNNTKTYDGEKGGKRIQIKITQGNSVDINDIPEHLLVLFLRKQDGAVFEVYNGPCDWLKNCKRTKNGWYSRTLNKLLEEDTRITSQDRIKADHPISKWEVGIRNN